MTSLFVGFPANNIAFANQLFAVRRGFYLRYLRLTWTGFLIHANVVGSACSVLNCLQSNIPSSEKAAKSARQSSFSHPRIEKSDSTFAALGNAEARPSQNSWTNGKRPYVGAQLSENHSKRQHYVPLHL
jgi:hypothetical protein